MVSCKFPPFNWGNPASFKMVGSCNSRQRNKKGSSTASHQHIAGVWTFGNHPCFRGQNSHYSHWIWDAMSHEALFDSGSHCMFGGDQIFRRVFRVRKSPTGDGLPPESQWLGQDPPADPALSRRGWPPAISAAWDAGIPTGSQHVQSSGVKQSADASIGISLAVNSGFRAGHNLASSWRACAWSAGLRNRRSYADQILPNGDRIYQKKETFPKFSQYIQNSLVMFSLKPSNFGNTFGPRLFELTGHLRTSFARWCLSASFDDASFARSKGSQSEHEILLR